MRERSIDCSDVDIGGAHVLPSEKRVTRRSLLAAFFFSSRVVSMGFSISYFFNIRHDEMLVAIPLTSGTQRTSGRGEKERKKKVFSSSPIRYLLPPYVQVLVKVNLGVG